MDTYTRPRIGVVARGRSRMWAAMANARTSDAAERAARLAVRVQRTKLIDVSAELERPDDAGAPSSTTRRPHTSQRSSTAASHSPGAG